MCSNAAIVRLGSQCSAVVKLMTQSVRGYQALSVLDCVGSCFRLRYGVDTPRKVPNRRSEGPDSGDPSIPLMRLNPGARTAFWQQVIEEPQQSCRKTAVKCIKAGVADAKM